MFTGIIAGVIIAAVLGYVHRVGMKRVEAKIGEGLTAIENAIHHHAATTASATTAATPPAQTAKVGAANVTKS